MSFDKTRGIVRENLVVSLLGIKWEVWYHISRLAQPWRDTGYSMVPYCNFPGLRTPLLFDVVNGLMLLQSLLSVNVFLGV